MLHFVKRFCLPRQMLAIYCFIPLVFIGCSHQDAPQGTDIFIADLRFEQQQYHLANIQQVTTRKGYDNQPYFLPDNSGLLYTAMLATDSGDYQTDSFFYSFSSKQHTNLTNSSVSEYSPLLLGDGKQFSAVVVEADNKQRLWAYPYQSTAEVIRLEDVEPVGYHAWGNAGDLAMFVLGEPSTLQFKQGKSGEISVVATNIGRSLRYIPERNHFSFTQLLDDGLWWLSEFDAATLAVTHLVSLPKQVDYYTWIDSETAVVAINQQLHLWTISKANQPQAWTAWADVSSVCQTTVSRLAVNQSKDKLAFVCNE